MWIIDVQCRYAEAAAGLELTRADFGVPPVGGGKTVIFPEKMRKKPFVPWTDGSPCRGGSTQDHMFSFDATYSQATVTANEENHANRKMHRGTVGQFIFGGDVGPGGPHYLGARPDTATGKSSVTSTSYTPPPLHTYDYKPKA